MQSVFAATTLFDPLLSGCVGFQNTSSMGFIEVVFLLLMLFSLLLSFPWISPVIDLHLKLLSESKLYRINGVPDVDAARRALISKLQLQIAPLCPSKDPIQSPVSPFLGIGVESV
ncbi:hypothetical protein Tco_0807403 [Tanacetum coccineum]